MNNADAGMSDVKGWLMMAVQAQPEDSTFEEIIQVLEIAQMLNRDEDAPSAWEEHEQLPHRVIETFRAAMEFDPAREGAIQRALEEVAARKAETAALREGNVRRGLEGIRDEGRRRTEGLLEEMASEMEAELNGPESLNDSPFTPEEWKRRLTKTDQELEAEDLTFQERAEGPRA